MRCLFVMILCTLGAAAQDLPPARSLFDGTTLAGWRGDPAVFTVRDGCIVGSTVGVSLAANTFLVLEEHEPANFELSLRLRLEGDNNSGVQYRSQLLPGVAFGVAGYQCDLHPATKYVGMLYDEQGAGIVAEHGQGVRWRDDGRTVLGGIVRPRAHDLAQWHQLRITAMGDTVWHEVDGVVVTVVQDERATAPRSGVIALQVHTGAPMTVWCKDVTLREYPSVEVMRQHVVVPMAMQALLRREALRAELSPEAATAAGGRVPMWIWDAAAGADEEVFFRRTFAAGAAPVAARLAVSCDNHCRVHLNGTRVGAGDAWQTPVVIDVASHLRAGDNVLAVHGSNDGGPAGLAVRLSWREGDTQHLLVSDGTWRCSDDDPDGWSTAGFDDTRWPAATVLATLGEPQAPWTRVLDVAALGTALPDDAPQVAVVDTGIELATGEPLEVLRLLDVPRSLGSWVSLCADDEHRLYASAEGGGLYRIVPAASLGELSTIERIPVGLGGCHGLLWFRNALYAVQNGGTSGLYRVTDSNGDDVLDRLELLRALDGDGEHGPHSVVIAPDGENLLVLCGNHTKLPELAASRVPLNWAEDRLLPRLEDPNRYWEGISPPGGWVCLVDPDGKRWELICCGFRNPYDLVVLPNGGVVTFDADMEWDMGLPWYRPARLLAVASGIDYGWRIGSAKWPADWPDAPPALCDIGPASPVGMACFGGMSAGLVALDWTFGTVYVNGHPWLHGSPLPLTDFVVATTASYVLTGGRGLPSTLLRLPRGLDLALDRADVAGRRWSEWDQPDPLLVAGWSRDVPARRPGLFAVAEIDTTRPAVALAGLLARVREGRSNDLQPVLDALHELSFGSLSPEDRIAWLRVHALALLRLGPASATQRSVLGERLLRLFPTGDERQDADLAELLAFVDAPGFLDKAVPLLVPLRPSPPPPWAELAQRNAVYGGVIVNMLAAMPPTGQIALANALRTVRHGWTLDQRRTLFGFLVQARTRKGGASYDGYLRAMVDAAWATCSPAEQHELAELVGKAKAEAPKFRATPPRGPGREWQLAHADGLLREALDGEDLAAGHNLFHAVGCAQCHYFAGEGGNHGPDLTSLGSKFTARDVFEALVEPGRVVSDQYSGSVLTKHSGEALFGQVVKGHHGDTEVYEVMPAVGDAVLVRVPVVEVAKVEPSPLSPMPAGLVNGLSANELRQLLGFLLSRGRGIGGDGERR